MKTLFEYVCQFRLCVLSICLLYTTQSLGQLSISKSGDRLNGDVPKIPRYNRLTNSIVSYPLVTIRQIQEVPLDSLLLADTLQSSDTRMNLQWSPYFDGLNGDTVTIIALCVVPPKVINYTQRGFTMILYDTGASPIPWGAIYVRATTDSVAHQLDGFFDVERGDVIMMTGRVIEFPTNSLNSFTQFVPIAGISIDKLITNYPIPSPPIVPVSTFYNGLFPGGVVRFSTGEQYEDLIVELSDLTVISHLNTYRGTFNAVQSGNMISDYDVSTWFTTRPPDPITGFVYRHPEATYTLPDINTFIKTLRGWITTASGSENPRGYRIAPIYDGVPEDHYIIGGTVFDLSAMAANHKVELSWGESDLPALLRYRIYRGTSPTPTTQIDSVNRTDTTYTDNGLTNGIRYYYRVMAIDSLLENSQMSTEVSAIPFLAPPADLSATPGNHQVILNWTASTASDVMRYRIYRGTSFPATTLIDSVPRTTTTYVNYGLTNGVQYYYRVIAVDSVLDVSSPSNEANATPFFTPPTNLVATAGNHKIILNWTASTTTDIIRYRIYRGFSSPASTLIDSVLPTETSYIDSTVINGTLYFYRVTAVDSFLNDSPFSNEESATPFNLPPEAVALEDVFLPNEGRELTSTLQFSSAGSSDPDGQIDSIYWYVEDVLVGREEQLTYDFGPGTMRVMLVVQDNDGAMDTSSATVTRSVFQTITNGPVLGGLSLLGEDILYAVATGDAIYRMDIDGNVLYTLEVGGDVLSASSIAADTTVYIASSDRNLYAFSKFGAPVWSALPLGGVLSATPTIDSIANRIYIGVQNRNFFAVNRISGSVAWSYFCDAPIKSSAVITLDRKLVFCSSKGTLYGFDLENLPNPIAPTWTLSLGDSVTSSPAMDQEGFIYVGTKTGKIIKILLGGGGGTIVWEQQAGSSIYASPVIDGSGTLYVGSMDSMFYAINTLTGSINWSFPTNGSIRSTAAVSNTGIIYFANDDGQVFALNSSGEVQWRYKHPSAISAPLLYRSGTLYLGTEDSLIVALYDGEGLLRKSYANALTVPAWGTFQGNNQRTGVQSVAGATPNFSFVVQSGWNMVSVPLAVNNYRKVVLFPTAVSAAYSFHNGYIQKDTLELGIGYWLKFSNAQDLGLNGIPLSNDTIIVSSGWNMIGSISSPVEVSTIVSNPPGMITSQFFGYNQGYFVSDSIYPAKGYWVKVNQNGQLILSSASIQSKVNRIRIVPTNELPPSPPDGEKTDDKLSIPKHFALKPNYPNPFNPSTVIRYQLPVKSYVTLKVYNVLGQEVGTVVNEVQDAGYKSAEFHASRLPSGVYYYRMTAVGQDGLLSYTDVKKMLLLK